MFGRLKSVCVRWIPIILEPPNYFEFSARCTGVGTNTFWRFCVNIPLVDDIWFISWSTLPRHAIFLNLLTQGKKTIWTFHGILISFFFFLMVSRRLNSVHYFHQLHVLKYLLADSTRRNMLPFGHVCCLLILLLTNLLVGRVFLSSPTIK